MTDMIRQDDNIWVEGQEGQEGCQVSETVMGIPDNPTITPLSVCVHKCLDRLLKKYDSDPYVLALLEEYMKTKLPGKLENAKSKQQTHLAKQLEVDKMCAEFVYKFLHQTNAGRFFYVPATKRYIEYLYNRYYHCHVDDITVCVSDFIRSHDNADWNTYRSALVGAVFANIRTTPLYTTIPTSTTIQSIYQKLVSTHIFATKSDAKFFLTAVGDHVLGKVDDKDLVYYYPENAHEFISGISVSAIQWFGVRGIDRKRGVFSSFRNCKAPASTTTTLLLNCFPDNRVTPMEQPTVWTNCEHLKLLALACHYSDRYSNAPTFLSKHCTDHQTIQYARTLCGEHAERRLVDRFYHEWNNQLIFTGKTAVNENGLRKIPDCHVLFLWRQFLRTNRIPPFVFDICPLTSILYSATTTYSFKAPSYLTLFSEQFTRFWDSSMVAVSPTEKYQRVEMSELSLLFRNWLNRANARSSSVGYTVPLELNRSENDQTHRSQRDQELNRLDDGEGDGDSVQWDDDQMMDAINYFYSGVVVDGKNVCAYSRHWNKFETVASFITEYLDVGGGSTPEHSPTHSRTTPLFAYRSYCESSRESTNLIVSKPYFDSVWTFVVGQTD